MQSTVQTCAHTVQPTHSAGSILILWRPSKVSSAQVSVFGRATLVLQRPDPLDVQADADAGAGVVLAPMPGLVKVLNVAAGDHVIVTGDVIEVESNPGEPLIHHGGFFRGLDSPAAP